MQQGKKTVVVSLDPDTDEICQLANSMGYEVKRIFVQKRKTPDVSSFVGSGKLEEIKEYIDDQAEKVDLVVVNGELKPSQWFLLEKKLDVKVSDRIRLILNIFQERADRKEAKLQVQLAQLQYERPFVRELIHRAKAGEHPGFMAGGEYQVDDYYEKIKKQTKTIKEKLEKIREERKIRRQHRHRGGFYQVSLAGYTNAGKSSLLNLISNENVKVDDKVFSTLSTTTRRFENRNLPILLTDTVGFISNLPSWIIDAFHSTLEELKEADEVLLVVDAAEKKDIVCKKLRVALDQLYEIGVRSSIITVLNKIDLISKKQLEKLEEQLLREKLIKKNEFISVSTKNRVNIDGLYDMIYDHLPHLTRIEIRMPVNDETKSFITWIYDKTNVIEVSYNKNVKLVVECDMVTREKIKSRSIGLKGEINEVKKK